MVTGQQGAEEGGGVGGRAVCSHGSLGKATYYMVAPSLSQCHVTIRVTVTVLAWRQLGEACATKEIDLESQEDFLFLGET